MKPLLSEKLTTIDHLPAFAQKVIALLAPGSIILLSGELGTGKTSFVSSFCRHFGVSHVQSPTYAIHHRYSGAVKIDHFDLYRLENADAVESAGFMDLLQEKSDFCFIEWPERIASADLPNDRPIFEIKIRLLAGSDRELQLFRLN